MFDRDRPLTTAEKAVQRKVREGTRLHSDDRALIQTRLRAMQRRHLEGQIVGIPSGALNIIPMPNVQPAVAAINARAQTLVAHGGGPDFGSSGAQLETAIRQINGSNTTAYFNMSANTTNLGMPLRWTANGSFGLGPLHFVRDSTGTMSGTQQTGGGNAGGNSAASGYNAGGGASGTVSGANVSGNGAVSGGGANSSGQSGGASAQQGGTASSVTETYSAAITMSCNIEWHVELGLNPLSWGGALADAFSTPSRGTATASNCGQIQFTIQS